MKIQLFYFVKRFNLKEDRQFWLNCHPNEMESKKYNKIVELLTRGNKKTDFKTISKKYKELIAKSIDRNEKQYSKLGLDGVIPVKTLESHLKYIIGIFDSEKKRQENLEKKSLQIISQTGIVVSLISFSVGTLYDKIVPLNPIEFYMIVSLYCLTLMSLFFSIMYAIKSLNLKLYARPSHKIIGDKISLDENKFIWQEISIRYNNINNNINLNDDKADNISKSFKFFFASIGQIIVFSIVTGTFLLSNELKKQSKDIHVSKIEIVNQIDTKKIIQRLDTIHRDLDLIKLIKNEK